MICEKSPAVTVVESLIQDGYEVFCVEPNIKNHQKYTLVAIEIALREFDIIVLLVNHDEFKSKSVIKSLTKKGI